VTLFVTCTKATLVSVGDVQTSSWWTALAYIELFAVQCSQQFEPISSRLGDPSTLSTSVLEPDLHLRLSEMQSGGVVGAFSRRQVGLTAERCLETDELVAGERSARFTVCLVTSQS